MLLCDDTVWFYPTPLIKQKASAPESIKSQPSTAKKDEVKPQLPANIMAKVGNVEIPKNKAARRRLAQSIRDNVDKIKKATEMKKKGKPLSNDLQRAIKKVVK